MNQPKRDHTNLSPFAVTTACGKHIVRQCEDEHDAMITVDLELKGEDYPVSCYKVK